MTKYKVGIGEEPLINDKDYLDNLKAIHPAKGREASQFLTERQNWFCSYIDHNLKDISSPAKIISKLFRGGIIAFNHPNPLNEDNISQAGNSIREIIYPQARFIKVLVNARDFPLFSDEEDNIANLYRYFSDLAHHNKNVDTEDFNNQIDKFIKVIYDAVEGESAVVRKADTSSKKYKDALVLINQFARMNPNKIDNTKILRKTLTESDPAIKYHFYRKVKPSWVKLLEKDGFISDEINKNAPKDRRQGSDEIIFLDRASKECPNYVARSLLKICPPDKLHHWTTRQFLDISLDLPKVEFIKLVPKILSEKWLEAVDSRTYSDVYLRDLFIKELRKYEMYEDLLVAIKSMLELKEGQGKSYEEEIEDFKISMIDLIGTPLFEYLLERPNQKFIDGALSILIEKTNQLIEKYSANDGKLSEEEITENSIDFAANDPLGLVSQDISFLCEKNDGHRYTRSDDGLRYLLFILKKILRKEITDDKQEALNIYEKYLGNFKSSNSTIVDSPVVWRLRLYLLSLAPGQFGEEGKKLLFHIFSGWAFSYVMPSEEYFIALRGEFNYLSAEDKKEYIEKVVDLHENYETDYPDYIKQKASDVLGMLEDYINNSSDTQKLLSSAGIVPNYNYKPEPNDAFKITTGWVSPEAPIGEESFSEIPVIDIADKLRTDWTSSELDKMNTADNQFSPINVKGVGDLLTKDIPKRIADYCANPSLFFEIGVLDPHYTHYYFEGINKAISTSPDKISAKELDNLINLCLLILKPNGDISILDNPRHNPYRSAIISMINFIELILKLKDEEIITYLRNNRGNLLKIVNILLSSNDPVPREEEKLEEAIFHVVEGENANIPDPIHIAINSIRGLAYQLFIEFIHFDADSFHNEAKVRIAADVKSIQEGLLMRENTRAIYSLFGRHMHSLYFSDKEWFYKHIPNIFPKDISKKNMYTAAWEGFIFSRIYGSIVSDPEMQEVYLRGFKLKENDFPPNQKRVVNIDQRIAQTIALAYLNMENFDSESLLYKRFWEERSVSSHQHFIRFLCLTVLNGSITNNFWQEKVKNLWNEVLKKDEGELLPLKEFGYLMTLKNNKFGVEYLASMVVKTLEKTKGRLSTYDPIRQSIKELAERLPEKALSIIELIFLRELDEGEYYHDITGFDGYEWREAFRIMRNKLGETKEGKKKCEDLLEKLLVQHSNIFVDLLDS